MTESQTLSVEECAHLQIQFTGTAHDSKQNQFLSMCNFPLRTQFTLSANHKELSQPSMIFWRLSLMTWILCML